MLACIFFFPKTFQYSFLLLILHTTTAFGKTPASSSVKWICLPLLSIPQTGLSDTDGLPCCLLIPLLVLMLWKAIKQALHCSFNSSANRKTASSTSSQQVHTQKKKPLENSAGIDECAHYTIFCLQYWQTAFSNCVSHMVMFNRARKQTFSLPS